MRFERHKNFITPDEIAALNAWVDEGVDKKWLDVGQTVDSTKPVNRVTSRFYSDRFMYPDVAYAVFTRIKRICGIAKFGFISCYFTENR